MDAERDNVKYPENPRERFDQLATLLEDELKDLVGQKKGSLNDLTVNGSLASFEAQVKRIARWEGGRSFTGTVRLGHDELTDIYAQVNEKFRIAIALVRAGGGGYQKTDNSTFGNPTI
ncbi:hypothetical protein [Nonomuraea lactucae]|uniref:hypothetical protein n=1 Tax=Nonomuraea lactucae TaxID=2249762 RepID=UPI000DE47C5C|nr:hypothetical protein [Nonomuraea lactucae]